MRRAVTVFLAGVAAIALFGVLVHGVLVLAHVSEPAAVTVHGVTARRMWATAVVVLALIGVGSGALALARLRGHSGLASGHRGALVALGTGLVALVNGALNVALATGGPGTGNGVVGGAAAVVLGLAGVGLGAVALRMRVAARAHDSTPEVHVRCRPRLTTGGTLDPQSRTLVD